MLRELHILNLAVIADLKVEFDPGLNCFTGQTGAGKSLVIGALEVLLGLRQPQDMLRKGAAEGRVTGVFHIAAASLRRELGALTDLPLEDEPELIIVRRLHESGRTSASINGQPVTGAMLKAVGETLVDVHGQHDAQYLLKPNNQLLVIDDFGGSLELRTQFADLFGRRKKLLAQQQELQASRTLRRQQLELYEFQATEIDEAQLVSGELEELQARHKVLGNLEKIKQQAGAAYGALYEEEGAATERVKMIATLLLDLAQLDDSLNPVATQVRDAALQLDDAAYNLRRYVDRLDLDPAELAQIAERLNLVLRMADKYASRLGGVDEVLAYRAQIGGQIAELKKQDEDFSQIHAEISGLEKQLQQVGAALSKARKKAVDTLVPKVHAQLADLGMKEARFAVEFQHPGKETAPGSTHAAEGASDGGMSSGASTGLETVEFMIAPNPGQPARPLRKIASGGELSRVMLGLKGILAQADRVSVLVFDEIDANVGGRLGTVIGQKLRDLARVHQVLCITHLPQIASFADRHLTIRKATSHGESFTTVNVVEGDVRITELAEMITGKDITPTSLAQAKELLGLAVTASKPAAAKKTKAKK
ncbi:MAG: DNA repair protein RecN [Phycisphaerae bacterium]